MALHARNVPQHRAIKTMNIVLSSMMTCANMFSNMGAGIIPIAKSAPSSRSCKGNPPIRRTREHLSSANHKTEKEMYDMWMDLEVQGTVSAGFRCTKCATAQGDQNPEHRTFKYDDMRKHVFEHGRGDHSHCKECSFFEELQGKPPIRRTREHLSSANHKTEKEMYDMWMDLEVQGTVSAGFRCTKCATAQGDQNPEHRTFKYDDMRKHVFEHGRGDHSHCKECSFFEELQGKPPIRRTREHLSSANHKTEKEMYDMWMDLEVQGTVSAGFRCTKCATAQGDQNHEHRTFKYDDMRKHVFEHGRGDHSHCKECSFFEELQGKPPIRRTREHLSSANHKTEKEMYDMWMDFEVQGTMSAGFRCTKCATAQGDQNPEHRTFKYDDMRKHVFEHGRGDHSHCKECSFFEELQGKPPIRTYSRASLECESQNREGDVRHVDGL